MLLGRSPLVLSDVLALATSLAFFGLCALYARAIDVMAGG